ncbi:MAG: PTS mannose transporter subunit IIAB [bacterium]|nr:PTS mannose transporter subunit IIAB [bacterium]
MVGIVIVSHKNLAETLIDTAASIMGHQDDITSVAFFPHENLEHLRERIVVAIKKVDSENGVIVFTDLLGGSCCNACAEILDNERVVIITGLNLAMVLDVMVHRRLSNLQEVANLAKLAGIKSIKNLKETIATNE